MNLSGKVALVTGGAVRLGRALTLALAEAGCHVCIHYGRSGEQAASTKAAAEAYGVQAHLLPADLQQVEAVQQLMPAAIARFGRVDILINNAATFSEGRLEETSVAQWEAEFAVNLRAPFLLSQAFARQGHFSREEPGAILNITDARVFRPAPDHFAYRLTKAALLTMTETLAQTLAPRIRVNALALGAILPPPGASQEALLALVQAEVPLQRPGDAGMVAENALHLLRQPFLTGVTLRLDGGQFL